MNESVIAGEIEDFQALQEALAEQSRSDTFKVSDRLPRPCFYGQVLSN